MKYVIRNAIKSDLPELLTLYEENGYSPEKLICGRTENVLNSIIYSPDKYLLVCETDGKIVSCITVMISDSLAHAARPYASAEHICVKDKGRDREAVSLLISKAKEIAAADGCYKLTFSNENSDVYINSLCLQLGFSKAENCVKEY